MTSVQKVANRWLRVAARAWWDDHSYEDLVDGVEDYESYDSLVHGTYSLAARELSALVSGKSRGKTADQIISDYEDAIKKASSLKGARKGVAFAKKHALGPLKNISRELARLEALRAQVEALVEALPH